MTVTNTDVTFVDESLFVAQALIEPKAFIALYDHYFPRIYNYIRYRCNDANTTDDLTALVFEKALSRIGDYDAQRGPFGAWLFAIARNMVNYHLRTQQRRRSLPLDELQEVPNGSPTPEEALIDAETHDELLAAMQSLPDRERDLLSLKFAARLTNRRIAQISGLTESNVGVILHRAVERLRAALQVEKGQVNE